MLIIQIQWKINLALFPLLVILLLENYAYAMTAKLSCDVQKFLVITLSEFQCAKWSFYIEHEWVKIC